MERLNREVKRRCDVVGAPLQERDDERQVERRYFSQASMERRKTAAQENAARPPLRLAPMR